MIRPPQGNKCDSCKNYFLGIAIDNYTEWETLNNAVKDLNDVAEILQTQYCFEETNMSLLINEAADEDNLIHAFGQLIDKLKPADNLIIYYSGHGHLDKKTDEGFWIPVAARLHKSADYLPNSRIIKFISAMQARHIFLISDSCFSGSIFKAGVMRGGSYAMDELEERKSRWGLCSGRHDEKVYDGPPGKNSPFCSSILTILQQNKRPMLNVLKLINDVTHLTGNEVYDQLPIGKPLQMSGHQDGEFIFKRQSTDEEAWQVSLNKNDIESYEDYLFNFPLGLYKSQAEEKIVILKDEEAWILAKTSDSLQEFNNYLMKFPNGFFREEAKGAILKKEDLQFYEKVKKSRLLSSYRQYLDFFPNGQKVEEIKELIKNFGKEEVLPKPPPIISPEIEKIETTVLFPKLIQVKGDIFLMGSNFFQREHPIHKVAVSDFSIGATLITFEEFEYYCQETYFPIPTDQTWGRKKRPVIYVTWYDAVRYCNWLSEKKGLETAYRLQGDLLTAYNHKANGYRLPTEAEWEFAASGGRLRDEETLHASGVQSVAWFFENSGDMTQPVGLKQPNALGLYDCIGNVYEWCFDYWQKNYYHQWVNQTADNPIGPRTGHCRVVKGGSFQSKRPYCRASYRNEYAADLRKKYIGFRVVRNG